MRQRLKDTSKAFQYALKKLKTDRRRSKRNDRNQLQNTEPTFLSQFPQFVKRNCPLDGTFCYEPLDVCKYCKKKLGIGRRAKRVSS